MELIIESEENMMIGLSNVKNSSLKTIIPFLTPLCLIATEKKNEKPISL